MYTDTHTQIPQRLSTIIEHKSLYTYTNTHTHLHLLMYDRLFVIIEHKSLARLQEHIYVYVYINVRIHMCIPSLRHHHAKSLAMLKGYLHVNIYVFTYTHLNTVSPPSSSTWVSPCWNGTYMHMCIYMYT